MIAESDAALASRLASTAGTLLVDRRRQLFAAGAPYWTVMDDGDATAQDFLAAELGRHRPDDAVLSEEAADDPRRAAADRVWIVDPLDGTREFGEPGRTDWAVHVALWELGSLSAGAVALPAVGRTYASQPPPVVPIVARAKPIFVASRSRRSILTATVAAAVDGQVVGLGSAGAKAMAVVSGVADAYLHAGGMYQWDSAAPVAVAAAAGLHVSRADGSPLVYNDPDPWLPDVLICRPELAEPILSVVASLRPR